MAISPPPIKDAMNSQRWLDWFNKVSNQLLVSVGQWSLLDFTGSNLTDIVTRNHNNLQNIDGAGNYHLSETQRDKVVGALPLPLKSYTVATLPDEATYENHLIYVSDETGGATVAFSDGTNWRRVQDRAIVS